MFEQIKKTKQKEGGFTLIELLVVIIILGILAAVVVFAVSGMSDKGEASSCKVDTRTLRTAQEAFFANSDASPGTYAANDQELVDGGFLSEPSALHEVTGGGAAYDIDVSDAQCGTVGNSVGQTPADI
jgi:general secretion pathway protein G